jgi:hypothetical protein
MGRITSTARRVIVSPVRVVGRPDFDRSQGAGFAPSFPSNVLLPTSFSCGQPLCSTSSSMQYFSSTSGGISRPTGFTYRWSVIHSRSTSWGPSVKRIAYFCETPFFFLRYPLFNCALPTSYPLVYILAVSVLVHCNIRVS